MTAPLASWTTAKNIAALFGAAIPSLPIIDDPFECALASSDIAGPGAAIAAAVLKPENHEQAEAIVSIARREGCALFPRGGGWSYSGGYTPSQQPAAIVDTGGLQSIVIERDASHVSTGAGVTLSALYDALGAAGLRVPSFGPLSGIGATVGGLVAQNGGFFGTARYGPVAEKSIVASTIVSGRGETITLTAADRVDGDLAPQPFAGDCGAFGLRTTVTLATMPRPAQTMFASFEFSTGEKALTALCSLAGIPGLGEAYVFDPVTHANLARSGFSLSDSASIASDLLTAGKGIGGIADLVRAARWSKKAIGEMAWSLHIAIEGDETATRDTLARMARELFERDGNAIPDVIPRVTRARPFRRIKALLGPDGEMWLPAHGVFDLAAAPAGLKAVETKLAERTAIMQAYGVRATILAVLMSNQIVIEPQLFWPDCLSPLHRRLCPPDQITAFGDRVARPAARAVALETRRALIDAMDTAGATHFQIGRTYAANPGVSDTARTGWAAWKRHLDPNRIINPGVLGL